MSTQPAPIIEPQREQIVLSSIFAAVEFLDPQEAHAMLREDLAAMPAQLMHAPDHQRVWEWVQQQVSAGELPALTTAHAAPELRGVPGETWANIAGAAPGGAINLTLELAALAETAARRSAVQAAQKLIFDLTRGAPVAETVSDAALVLGRVQDGKTRSHEAQEYASALEMDAAKEQNKLPPISTGIPVLDAQLNSGFQPGEFVIALAPTGHGKTRLGLGMLTELLKQGIGSTYCSTEQGETGEWTDDETGEIRRGHRTVAAAERLAYGVGRTFRRSSDSCKRSRAGRKLVTSRTADGRHALLHVFHDELTIHALEAQGVHAALRGHKVMFIDNLEHIQGRKDKGDTGAQYLATIAQDLSRIAKRNRLVVVLLAQPKPACGELDRPATLNEIADSTAIARPADYVITCWRPTNAQKDAYKNSLVTAKCEEDVVRSGGHVGKPSALISIAKIRSEGFGGMVHCAWDEHTGRWYDPAHPSLPLPAGGGDAQ